MYISVWFSPGDDVCWYHLQESRVGCPDFPPCVTQPHQTFRNTPGQDGEKESEREVEKQGGRVRRVRQKERVEKEDL